MRPWDTLPLIPIACGASAFAWASFAARRAGESHSSFAARALLGGAAAFGIAFAAYGLAPLASLDLRWERVVAGDLDALVLAACIGLIEEGAKLAGILLVTGRRARTSTALAAGAGVAAGFSALESLLVLHGVATSPLALTRVALGPAAHAILAVPLVIAVAEAARRGGRAWLLLAPALAASAALHAGADLSLGLPQLGTVAHAAVLAGPALWLFARARRPVPALARDRG
jgi:RsiW-degrading membrane proteinase PrsW (M82 family)